MKDQLDTDDKALLTELSSKRIENLNIKSIYSRRGMCGKV